MSLGELFVVFVVALIVFGPERLPEMARTLGKWVGKFRRLQQQWQNEFEQQIKLDELQNNIKRAADAERLAQENTNET